MIDMPTCEADAYPELLALLRHAAKRELTPEEIRAQRRSFIRAEIGFGSDADETAYRVVHARGDRAEMDRLTAEGEARMAQADEIMERMGL